MIHHYRFTISVSTAISLLVSFLHFLQKITSGDKWHSFTGQQRHHVNETQITDPNQPHSEFNHSLTFHVRHCKRLQCIMLQTCIRVCCHSNKTHSPTANVPNTAQLEGTPYRPQSYIRVHAVVRNAARDRHTKTHRRPWPLVNIHFTSAMPHATCVTRDNHPTLSSFLHTFSDS